MSRPELISVVIPARNEEGTIGELVANVLGQQSRIRCPLEVLVVDDGSEDRTQANAEAAGARVIRATQPGEPGNPARARNLGARAVTGDLLVFLDADCLPQPDWLSHLLRIHANGAACVGGSLGMPPDLPLSARCDYYSGWYNVAPETPPGVVPNHPPCNLSVRRSLFTATGGFTERQPVAYAHEELAWQSELQAHGEEIVFEPRAMVLHRNRPGFGNLLRRNYRWGYSSIEAKSQSGSARYGFLYRSPLVLILGALPFAVLSSAYILCRWMRARRLEPLVLSPIIILARSFYVGGMVVGGVRWLSRRTTDPHEHRPLWE